MCRKKDKNTTKVLDQYLDWSKSLENQNVQYILLHQMCNSNSFEVVLTRTVLFNKKQKRLIFI